MSVNTPHFADHSVDITKKNDDSNSKYHNDIDGIDFNHSAHHNLMDIDHHFVTDKTMDGLVQMEVENGCDGNVTEVTDQFNDEANSDDINKSNLGKDIIQFYLKGSGTSLISEVDVNKYRPIVTTAINNVINVMKNKSNGTQDIGGMMRKNDNSYGNDNKNIEMMRKNAITYVNDKCVDQKNDIGKEDDVIDQQSLNNSQRSQRDDTMTTSNKNQEQPSVITTKGVEKTVMIPRDYQLNFVEIAKKENIIVHLETGAGKTLIALLLIQHYLKHQHEEEELAKQQQDMEQEELQDLQPEQRQQHGPQHLQHEKQQVPQSINCPLISDNGHDRKIILFLVPSVALAEQQYVYLRKQLPDEYKIVKLCGNTQHTIRSMYNIVNLTVTKKTLSDIRSCHVLVATHGSCLELLNHYRDVLTLSRCSLIIMDECHHCQGNAPYALIMRLYYHQRSINKPRILGLTASPLINLRRNATDIKLYEKLNTLEDLMDAKIVSKSQLLPSSNGTISNFENCLLENGMVPQKIPSTPNSNCNNIPFSNMNIQNVARNSDQELHPQDEHHTSSRNGSHPMSNNRTDECIFFEPMKPLSSDFMVPLHIERRMTTLEEERLRSSSSSFEHHSHHFLSSPSNVVSTDLCADLHDARKNQMDQIKHLYYDGGPLLAYMYCVILYQNTKFQRNHYLNESLAQFHVARQYLHYIIKFCREECANELNSYKDHTSTIGCPKPHMYGLSHKLNLVTQLLEKEIECKEPSSQRIGIVFVERRITALALKLLFQYRQDMQEALVQEHNSSNDNNSYHAWMSFLLESALQDFAIPELVGGSNTQLHSGSNAQTCSILLASFSPTSLSRKTSSSSTTTSPTKRQKIRDDSVAYEHSNISNSDSQFMDASDEDTNPPEPFHHDMKSVLDCDDSNDGGQFDDAGPDVDASYHLFQDYGVTCSNTTENLTGRSIIYAEYQEHANSKKRQIHLDTIRCGALVRNSKEIMRSSNSDAYDLMMEMINNDSEGPPLRDDQKFTQRRNSQHDTSKHKQMLQEKFLKDLDSKSVMKGLEDGRINVLFATSVVEEGIDIPDCSFVVVFDKLRSDKEYIQMKGRARRSDSRFYVLEETTNQDIEMSQKNSSIHERMIGNEHSMGNLPLINGSIDIFKQNIVRMHEGIASQERQGMKIANISGSQLAKSVLPESINTDEYTAFECGYYDTQFATVTSSTAKTLLNRFAMQQPFDPTVRSSKEALSAYMPSYDSVTMSLTLPAYIDSALRTFVLPDQYAIENMKDKDRIAKLSLMACVRLHKNELLSDRLLPLSKTDVRKRMVSLFSKGDTSNSNRVTTRQQASFRPGSRHNTKIVYVHKILLEGKIFECCRVALKGNGVRLAIVTPVQIPMIPMRYDYWHKEFGSIVFDVDLTSSRTVECTEDEYCLLEDFFSLLMNCRWRKRTKNFSYRKATTATSTFMEYSVGCITDKYELDWDTMKQQLQDSKRTPEELKNAVESSSAKDLFDSPRLWCPMYDELSTYLCYGPSDLLCSDVFVSRDGNGNAQTYADYFRMKYKFVVPPDSQVFRCQSIWSLPVQPRQSSTNAEPRPFQGKRAKMEDPLFCPNLSLVGFPREICREFAFAHAALYLESILLPQVLYRFERCLTAQSLVDYCSRCFPTLASCLTSKPLDDVVDMLTAKSCDEGDSYERIEWLGDGVLKLLQTDSILKSSDLRNWIRNFHEGDLDMMRSEMCSNMSLRARCLKLQFNRYVLTAKLARGQWSPAPMERYCLSPEHQEVIEKAENGMASGKTCADILEAILGFAYLCKGYKFCVELANELKITVPTTELDVDAIMFHQSPGSEDIQEIASQFTGYSPFRNSKLVEEAFTHPTNPSAGLSSYERLEWIGDAVLCLAVRHWIFDRYYDTKVVGEMVC